MSTESEGLYHGLSAAAYDLLLPRNIGDAELYRQAILDDGQPALEVGAGTGRLLLDFVAEGLAVEGVDASADMLAICCRKAAERGLTVTLHEQSMQALDLGGRFRTIYLPIFAFQHVIELAEVEASLRRFHAHLEPGGRLLLSLLIPSQEDFLVAPAVPGQWRLRRQAADDEGVVYRSWELLESDADGVRRAVFRYEKLSAGVTVAREDAIDLIRWYTQDQFRELLLAAGFVEPRAVTLSGDEAPADAGSFVFTAIRR